MIHPGLRPVLGRFGSLTTAYCVWEHPPGNVYLSTYSFEAPRFYEKLGYEIFGRLEDFPPGHTKFYMRKSLAPALG